MKNPISDFCDKWAACWKARFLRPLLVGFMGFFCAVTLPALAETIRYDGKTPTLQNPPAHHDFFGSNNTLAPAGYTNASGNTLMIDYPAASGSRDLGSRDLRYVFGGFSNTPGVAVTNNTVDVINGPDRKITVIGGYNGAGNSENNTAIVRNGGASTIIGGMSPSGNATGNTARFSGGFASSVTGGAAQSGNATGNIVHLSGGIVLGSVVGGYIDSASNATGNTVIVSDAADIKHVPLLYGGYANQDPGDIRTGNTLHLDNWTGGVGAVIKNFEHYRFTLPAGVRGGQNILPVIGSGSMDLGANARISVDFSGSPCAFKVGEEINLINTRSASGVITGTLANTTAASTVDGTTYTFRLALTDARDSGYRLLTATLIGQKRQSSVAQKRKRASVMRKRD